MVAEIPSRKPTTDAESLFITEEKSFAPKPKVSLSLSLLHLPLKETVPFHFISSRFVTFRSDARYIDPRAGVASSSLLHLYPHAPLLGRRSHPFVPTIGHGPPPRPLHQFISAVLRGEFPQVAPEGDDAEHPECPHATLRRSPHQRVFQLFLLIPLSVWVFLGIVWGCNLASQFLAIPFDAHPIGFYNCLIFCVWMCPFWQFVLIFIYLFICAVDGLTGNHVKWGSVL